MHCFYEHLLNTTIENTTSDIAGAAAYRKLTRRFGKLSRHNRNDVLFGKSLASRVVTTHFLAVSLLMSTVAFTEDADLQACPLSSIPVWIKQICDEVGSCYGQALIVRWPLTVADASNALMARGWVSISGYFAYISKHPDAFLLASTI